MNRLSASFCTLALLCAAPVAFAESLLIRDVTLIDGNGGPPQAGMSVLVDGPRIAAVSSGPVEAHNDTTVIDGTGKYLIPGLMDMHIHLLGAGAWQGLSVISDKPVDYDQGLTALHGFLYAGVTSVFDAGNDPDYIYEMRRRERAGEIVSPRLFVTGKLISYEGSWLVPYAGVASPDWPAAIPFLDEKLARGPDLQKVTYERFGTGPRTMVKQMPKDLMEQLIGYIESKGVRTTMHISHEDLARDGIAAGVDTLAHPVNVGRHAPDFPELVRDSGVVVSTTLAVFDDIVRLSQSPEYLQQPLYAATLEPEEIATRLDKGKSNYERNGLPPWFRILLPYVQRNLKELHEAGVTLALATDRSDGATVHREMELLVKGGISPADVIVIATRGGARFLGKEDELGTVETGKYADLVLLNADPTADIGNARDIALVIKHGAVIDRTALHLPVND